MGRPKGPQLEKQRVSINPGQRHGSLVVLGEAPAIHVAKWRVRMARCRCDCGAETIVRLDYLRSGHTTSCGCRRAHSAVSTHKTHGSTGTRLHGIWAGMKARCANPRVKSYRYYGAKGVAICAEWQEFEPFRDWAMANGYRDDLTIDRIDPFGNYEPGNCRWITKSEQRYNRRDTAVVAT